MTGIHGSCGFDLPVPGPDIEGPVGSSHVLLPDRKGGSTGWQRSEHVGWKKRSNRHWNKSQTDGDVIHLRKTPSTS